MAAKPSELTIDALLELPRPSGTPLANPSGTTAIWASSTFSFSGGAGDGKTTRVLHLVDLSGASASSKKEETVAPTPFVQGLSSLEAAWLDDSTVLFTRPPGSALHSKDGKQVRLDAPHELSDTDTKEHLAAKKKETPEVKSEVWAKSVKTGDEYLLGQFPVPVADLKVHVTASTKDDAPSALLAFSAVVFPDSDIYTVAAQEKEAKKASQGSDVRVYDSLFVRHWDEWTPTAGQRKQVQVVQLTKNPETFAPASVDEDGFEHVEAPLAGTENVKKGEDIWRIVTRREKGVASDGAKPHVLSPLAGTSLESPVGPFGGAGDFSLSDTHLVFHAKSPHVNGAYHTRTIVYIVPLFPSTPSHAKPEALSVAAGAASSPVFDPSGERVAWLEMRTDGYEADRNRVVIYEVEDKKRHLLTEEWDLSPGHVLFSADGKHLFLTGEQAGQVKLFTLPAPRSPKKDHVYPEPTVLSHGRGGVSSVAPLGTTSLLLSGHHSFTSPNELRVLAPSQDNKEGVGVRTVLSASLTAGTRSTFGLHEGEDIWFPAANELGLEVHGFVLFPPELVALRAQGIKSAAKKYPLAFLVHGGPQGAWTDSWSTRWNPNSYTARGYIVVAINPTGSTGYGQKFTDDIKNEWGGRPFLDLVSGLDFVKETYPEIDDDRMVMLGASYGGYMANWIQGHNDQMGFKAIVCHDGVFATNNVWYSTEELYFPEHDFGGTPYEVPGNYDRWDPRNHIRHWRTPQLIIHGGRDFRLTESEGIGAFNTLQRLGVPSRFVYFEHENHWVLSAHNGRRWHQEVFRWIDEWTQVVKKDVAAVEDVTEATPSAPRPAPLLSREDTSSSASHQDPRAEARAAMAKEVSRKGYRVEYPSAYSAL